MKPSRTDLGAAILVASLASMAVGLAGCGSKALSPAATSSPLVNVTGEWRFATANNGLSMAAGLVDTAGSVTGTATVYGCTSTPQPVALTGTVSPKGALTLRTSQLASDAVLTLSGQLSSDGKTASNTTLASSGSGCSAASGQVLTGNVYSPASGSYTGTFTGSDGVGIGVTATLSQSTTPGPGGSYTLSGTVSFPTSPCLATATINSAVSTVTGGNLSATYATTVAGQAVSIAATGTADQAATNIVITNWTISGGTCDGYSGTGTLSD